MRPCEDGGRSWSGVSLSQGLWTKAIGRGKEKFFLRAFGGSMALLIPWFLTSSLQNLERIKFCCFQPPSLCLLLRHHSHMTHPFLAQSLPCGALHWPTSKFFSHIFLLCWNKFIFFIVLIMRGSHVSIGLLLFALCISHSKLKALRGQGTHLIAYLPLLAWNISFSKHLVTEWNNERRNEWSTHKLEKRGFVTS